VLLLPDVPLLRHTESLHSGIQRRQHTRTSASPHCGHTHCSVLHDAVDRHKADVWLINSCTVKSPSQSQMASVISDAKARGAPVVVAGCVPQGDKRSRDLEVRDSAECLPLVMYWLRAAAWTAAQRSNVQSGGPWSCATGCYHAAPALAGGTHAKLLYMQPRSDVGAPLRATLWCGTLQRTGLVGAEESSVSSRSAAAELCAKALSSAQRRGTVVECPAPDPNTGENAGVCPRTSAICTRSDCHRCRNTERLVDADFFSNVFVPCDPCCMQGVSLVGVTQIDRIVDVVEEALRGNTVSLLAKKALPSLDLPKVWCCAQADMPFTQV
jgi:Uncharacterized protein family UPF0004